MYRGPDQRSAARIRGVAAGAVSASLAVAAHGGAGGRLPNATGVLLLLGLSAVVAVAATCTPTVRRTPIGLFTLLSGAQLVGHEVLVIAGHQHGSAGAGMLAAHVAAVGACAVLIALAERIGPRCAAALRRILPQLSARVPARRVRSGVRRCVGYHTQLTAVLAASMSRRGPPRMV